MKKRLKYADIEGLAKKDPFKRGILKILEPTSARLLPRRLRIVPESLGEPAALIDFMDYDFYLAFKTDSLGTKGLIADIMAAEIRKKQGYSKARISKLYSGLGQDLIASNVNDLICLGAVPFALSDEVAAGSWRKFTDKEFIAGLFQGFQKGALEAGITIPSGESPTMTDVVAKNTITMTASALGLVKPKERVILGQKVKAGDAIFGLASNGIHTNGLSLARKIVEKLPKGYFTRFEQHTVGEELLKPTKIYVKPILEMLEKEVEIHYMSNISGGGLRKISRAQKNFTYVVKKLPQVSKILAWLQRLEKIPDNEAYETWNMGLGFVIFAPETEEAKISQICQKHSIAYIKLGYVEKGKKQVIIKPKNIVY